MLQRYKLSRNGEVRPEQWVGLGETFLERGHYDDVSFSFWATSSVANEEPQALYFFEKSRHKQGCLLAKAFLQKVELQIKATEARKARNTTAELKKLEPICKATVKLFEEAGHILEAVKCLEEFNFLRSCE